MEKRNLSMDDESKVKENKNLYIGIDLGTNP
jgi:hypothetical protein